MKPYPSLFRLQALRTKVCARYAQTSTEQKYTAKRLIYNQNGYSLSYTIAENSRTVYCYSPRVASSTWLEIIAILTEEPLLIQEVQDQESYYK